MISLTLKNQLLDEREASVSKTSFNFNLREFIRNIPLQLVLVCEPNGKLTWSFPQIIETLSVSWLRKPVKKAFIYLVSLLKNLTF